MAASAFEVEEYHLLRSLPDSDISSSFDESPNVGSYCGRNRRSRWISRGWKSGVTRVAEVLTREYACDQLERFLASV